MKKDDPNNLDEDNFEDIAESLIIVRNHLDLLAKLFHTFDDRKYFRRGPHSTDFGINGIITCI